MIKTCDVCHKNWEDDGHYSSVTIILNKSKNIDLSTTMSPTLCPVCLYNMNVAINLVIQYPDFEDRVRAFIDYKKNESENL